MRWEETAIEPSLAARRAMVAGKVEVEWGERTGAGGEEGCGGCDDPPSHCNCFLFLFLFLS
jgi:hypothetical protein